MSKLKSYFIIFIGLFIAAPCVYAVNIDTYMKIEEKLANESREDVSATAKMFAYYLLGVAEGSGAASTLARYQNKDNKSFHDYCPPESLVIDGDFVRKTIDSYIVLSDSVDKSMNVAVVFMAQMAKNYPCK